MSDHPNILVVGAADTGRAPMTAALLRRLLAQAGYPAWQVASAGLTGHDGDPSAPECRSALAVLGVSIDDHRARSLTPDMAQAATLLLAVERGIAHVLCRTFPVAPTLVCTVGELAGKQRDIPDLFRMQVGVWLTYAHEIDGLLRDGLPRLVTQITGQAQPTPPAPVELPPMAEPAPADVSAPAAAPAPAERAAAAQQCVRILTLLQEMPEVVHWAQAREQLVAAIRTTSTATLHPHDLVQAYAALLHTLLELHPEPPTTRQAALLLTAAAALGAPIDQPKLTELSRLLARWDDA